MKAINAVIMLVAIVVGSVLYAAHFAPKKDIIFDNTRSPAELIDTVYRATEVQELMYQINSSGVSYEALQSRYLIECIRSTSCGDYIVLFQDNGERAFIFLNKDQVAVYCISSSCFKSFRDFSFVNPGSTTLDDIVSFDPETILSPVSAMSQTGHILTDGILLIDYSGLDGDKILEKPVVKSFQFIPNSDIEAYIQEVSGCLVPYILPIDKFIE